MENHDFTDSSEGNTRVNEILDTNFEGSGSLYFGKASIRCPETPQLIEEKHIVRLEGCA